MIKQIALPTHQERQQNKLIDTALQKQMRGTQASKVTEPSDEDMAVIVSAAQDELNAALAEGYKIIAQYPFIQRSGLNLILHKPD